MTLSRRSAAMSLTLDQLPLGEAAVVTHLRAADTNRRRLMDLGILPGTRLVAELKSPLGDPIAYRVRDTLIALRRDQARQIEIELVEAAVS
jgi:ferrous iron transport protein A